MPYNFAAEFSHKETLQQTFFEESPIFCTENEKIVVFEAPFGGLGRQADGQTDGQTLIGKTALHTMQRGKNQQTEQIWLVF